MIKKLGTRTLILLLIGFSAVLYLLQYVFFRKPADTGFYFLQDLAFVPISVLLVTLGLNTVMVYRQRQQMLEKISIVINEFFAEAGYDLIRGMRGFIVGLPAVAGRLQPAGRWQDADFCAAVASLEKEPVAMTVDVKLLPDLAVLLGDKKAQILRLFENPSLLEHDRFTDMLWAVYHVHDELRSRDDFASLPASDVLHLAGDLQRAMQLLLVEWLESMRQLKIRYPYLYSLAVRKCPLGDSDIIIKAS